MLEIPQMSMRQAVAISLIHGVAGSLTCCAVFFIGFIDIGVKLAESDRMPLLETAGVMGIPVALASMLFCANFVMNGLMPKGQFVRRRWLIFARPLRVGLIAFVFSAGVLILVHEPRPSITVSSLLAGLGVALIWCIDIILVYLVWPEGLSIPKWLWL